MFRIFGDWHVGWWNLISSVRLIQVGNDRNYHFRYSLGVRLLKVSFKGNKGNKFRDFGYCLLNRVSAQYGVRLIQVSLYIFFCFIFLFTSSSPCCKDQFAFSYIDIFENPEIKMA